jgi:hypothetical protein
LFGHPPIAPTQWPGVDEAVSSLPRGYHLRAGDHDLTAVDWGRYLDLADQVWR